MKKTWLGKDWTGNDVYIYHEGEIREVKNPRDETIYFTDVPEDVHFVHQQECPVFELDIFDAEDTRLATFHVTNRGDGGYTIEECTYIAANGLGFIVEEKEYDEDDDVDDYNSN